MSTGHLWHSCGGGFWSRSRRASARALRAPDSPFYAGRMLVRTHDRGIDGMFLVGGRAYTRQRFERRIPHAQLAPAREAYEDRIPITVSFGHIAPGRAGAQYPKNAVDRSPLVGNGRTAFATIRKQGVENAPFRVRQIAATQCCLPKAALNQNSIPPSKPSTRPSLLARFSALRRARLASNFAAKRFAVLRC